MKPWGPVQSYTLTGRGSGRVAEIERVKGVIRIKIIQGQVIVTLPKAVLVMTKQEFIEALRRGKTWRRRQSLTQRLTTHGADRPQMLTTAPCRQAHVDRRTQQRRHCYMAS